MIVGFTIYYKRKQSAANIIKQVEDITSESSNGAARRDTQATNHDLYEDMYKDPVNVAANNGTLGSPTLEMQVVGGIQSEGQRNMNMGPEYIDEGDNSTTDEDPNIDDMFVMDDNTTIGNTTNGNTTTGRGSGFSV